MTSTPHGAGPLDDEASLAIEDLVRRQGVTPLMSVSDLAQPGLFESNDEYEAFLADLYASRRSLTGCWRAGCCASPSRSRR